MLQPIIINLPGVSEVKQEVSAGGQGEWTAQCLVRLERSRTGWRALEFLAWWAKDFGRRGTETQLLPIAKAPIDGDRIQFGETLEFCLHLGVASTQAEADALLRRAATDFHVCLEKYRHVVT
jgi:hypothetical protein